MGFPQAGAGLYCQVVGEGGTPIVFLHGLGVSSRYWLNRVDPLAAGYQLVVPDLLGFGRSPWPSTSHYSIDQHVTAIWRLLEAMDVPQQQPAFVGHSLGSILALAAAARNVARIRRLVLISLPYFLDENEAAMRMTRHSFLNEMGMRSPLSSLGTWLMARSPLVMRILGPAMLSRMPADVSDDVMRHNWTAFSRTHKNCIVRFRLEASLDAVRSIPVLLIHGDRDPIAPLKRISELSILFPNVRVSVIPGAGHHPLLTHPDDVMSEMTRFLKGMPLDASPSTGDPPRHSTYSLDSTSPIARRPTDNEP